MRKFKIFILSIMTICCLCMGLVGCKDNKEETKAPFFKETAIVEGFSDYNYTVSNSIDSINFADLISEEYANSFRVFKELEGKNEIVTKATKLNVGNNLFYIFDGAKVYPLNIYRNKIIDIEITSLKYGISGYKTYTIKHEENTYLESLEISNYCDERYYEFICLYNNSPVDLPLLVKGNSEGKMKLDIKSLPKEFQYYISNGEKIIDTIKVYGYTDSITVYSSYSWLTGHPNNYQKLGYYISGCKIFGHQYSMNENREIILSYTPKDIDGETIEILYQPISIYFEVPFAMEEAFIANYELLNGSNYITVEMLDDIILKDDIIGMIYNDGYQTMRITSAQIYYSYGDLGSWIAVDVRNDKMKLSDYVHSETISDSSIRYITIVIEMEVL